MATSEVVRERALTLARSGADREEALRELQACCEGRRVGAVRARQQLVADVEGGSDPGGADVAIELLDELLIRLPV